MNNIIHCIFAVFIFFMSLNARGFEEPVSLDVVAASVRPKAEDKSLLFPVGYEWKDQNKGWDRVVKFGNYLGYHHHRDIAQRRVLWQDRAVQVYDAFMKGALDSKIPSHVHRFWITKDHIPDTFLTGLKKEADVLKGFSITLWCADLDKRQELAERFSRLLEGHVQLRDISEIWVLNPGAEDLYNRLQAANLFSECGLLLASKVLYRYGGIYVDEQRRLERSPVALLGYDFFVSQKNFHFDGGIWGCCAQFPPLKVYLDHLILLPHIMHKGASKEHHQHLPHLCDELGFTLKVENHIPEDRSVLFVPEGALNAVGLVSNPSFPPDEKVWNAKIYLPAVSFLETSLVGFWVRGEINKSKKFAGLLNASWETIVAQRQASLKLTQEMFMGMRKAPLNAIPHITHQTWITSETDPKQIPDTHIEATLQRWFRLGSGWRHILWVQQEDLLAPSIERLRAGYPDLEVREVDQYFLRKGESPEEHPHKKIMRTRKFYDAFIHLKTYVTATDMLRKEVLFQWGGLYADMGILFLENLTPLIDRAHGVFYGNVTINLFDTTVLGALPGDAALKRYFDIFDKLHTFPELTKDPNPHDYIALVGQLLYNICYSTDCAEKVTVPLILGKMINNPNHFGSWRGLEKGKLGTTSFAQAMSKRNLYLISRTDD